MLTIYRSAGARDSEPPPYHNWQEAVPDTTTFPPPPVAGNLVSSTGNASSDDADRALEFCDRNPLSPPVQPPAVVYLSPIAPPEFRGSIYKHGDSWRGSTRDRHRDCLVSSNLPVYFSLVDSPFVTERSKTIYFEVKLLGLRAGPAPGEASGLSIGFVAQPYPTWCSPGWQRGSLGVFSDDGCRFVNDCWGGKDFTQAFSVGETLGLGMTFHLPDHSNASPQTHKLKVEVFFTRNGQRAGGWDLHEETDEEAGGVEGLEGDFDLHAAVGLFGGVDFEVCYNNPAAGWLWRP